MTLTSTHPQQLNKFISRAISWKVLIKPYTITYVPLFPCAYCYGMIFGLCWFYCRGVNHHMDCGVKDVPIVKPNFKDPLHVKEKFIQTKVCPSMSFICLFIGLNWWFFFKTLEINYIVIIIVVWIICKRPFWTKVTFFSFSSLSFKYNFGWWSFQLDVKVVVFRYLFMCTKLKYSQFYNKVLLLLQVAFAF